jgi:hypothetical protein
LLRETRLFLGQNYHPLIYPSFCIGSRIPEKKANKIHEEIFQHLGSTMNSLGGACSPGKQLWRHLEDNLAAPMLFVFTFSTALKSVFKDLVSFSISSRLNRKQYSKQILFLFENHLHRYEKLV